jgi:hypothetical protein
MVRNSGHGRNRASKTCTNTGRHSDPMVPVYTGKRTNTHTFTTHNTDHATCPTHLIHRLSLPHPDNSCWDNTKEVDLIISTDGSVLFGVGYHSLLIAMKDKYTLLAGGGPDDGPGRYMTSCRSELGGIIAGLTVLGTILCSGRTNVRSIKFICDNSAAIMASKRDLTQSIFHRIEGNHDLITMMKYLQLNWFNNTQVKHVWVKGHADRVDKYPNHEERLNIKADALCDLV